MADAAALDEFIERWRRNEGGAERANFPLFLTELCQLLGLPRPDPADATHERNDYVFERAVDFHDEAGRTGHGRIDLYKRGCFVLEAKQSRLVGGAKEVLLPEQGMLPGLTVVNEPKKSQAGMPEFLVGLQRPAVVGSGTVRHLDEPRMPRYEAERLKNILRDEAT